MNVQAMIQTSVAALLCALMSGPVQAVTPIENEIQKLLASDGADFDSFGWSVAINGDTALIGAPLDDDNGFASGSAYVFAWDGAAWVQEAKLLPADGAVFDRFGWSVALDGDTALIGAIDDDDNGRDSGSAYVFAWDGTAWVQEAKLLPADGAAFDRFGLSVALDGGTALIGVEGDDDNGSASGSAYVFARDGTAWVQEAKLLPADGAAFDRFGRSVALDGGTALIGAYFDVDNGSRSGSAYVFRWDGSAWVQEAKLLPADGADSDFFGFSVALDGGTALIGAFGDDDNGSGSGSAYVFAWDGAAWGQEAKLVPADGAPDDRFGFSVALDGSTALIGAPFDDDNGSASGSAYVFAWDGAAWLEVLKLLPADGATFDRFGFSVALDGGTALIGAHTDDDNGSDSGSAYVFEVLIDDQPPLVSDVTATPNPVALNTGFEITATVDDSTTGASLIDSASYTINGGAPVAMSASDGAFDSPTENVTATVGAGLEAGVYDICVTGTDAAGNVSKPACTLLAVYDPDGGFVTGGGWIDSPEGAYAPDPTLTGKANFGFVSKYKKGSNEPIGQTEFNFKTAGLNFHSDNCEWLVVSGARAQFKGTGTINDAGNYGFMITAIDEALTESTDADLFRIKIWDIDSDNVVYDNQMGGDDSADPSTTISAGSIVIHTPKDK